MKIPKTITKSRKNPDNTFRHSKYYLIILIVLLTITLQPTDSILVQCPKGCKHCQNCSHKSDQKEKEKQNNQCKCLDCALGYRLEEGWCVKCSVDYCSDCQNNGKSCRRCLKGYFRKLDISRGENNNQAQGQDQVGYRYNSERQFKHLSTSTLKPPYKTKPSLSRSTTHTQRETIKNYTRPNLKATQKQSKKELKKSYIHSYMHIFQCAKCSQNCIECSEADKCSKCNLLYTLEPKGGCVLDFPFIILLFIIGFALGVLIGVGSYYLSAKTRTPEANQLELDGGKPRSPLVNYLRKISTFRKKGKLSKKKKKKRKDSETSRNLFNTNNSEQHSSYLDGRKEAHQGQKIPKFNQFHKTSLEDKKKGPKILKLNLKEKPSTSMVSKDSNNAKQQNDLQSLKYPMSDPSELKLSSPKTLNRQGAAVAHQKNKIHEGIPQFNFHNIQMSHKHSPVHDIDKGSSLNSNSNSPFKGTVISFGKPIHPLSQLSKRNKIQNSNGSLELDK